MAVVNTKSTVITNADATPVVFNKAGLAKGRVLRAIGTLETAAGDTAPSVYRFARIPSNAIINSIKMFNDDLDSASSVVATLGLHQTAANGGAAVDADVFATSLASLQAAVTTGTELRFALLDINGAEKRAWELAAATVDPQIDYDVTMTITTATGLQAGTATLVVDYTVE